MNIIRGENVEIPITLDMSEDDYKTALEFHRNTFVIDCHSDINKHILSNWRQGITNSLIKYHLPRIREGGVNAIILSTFVTKITEGNPLREMLNLIEVIRKEIQITNDFKIVKSSDELQRAYQKDQISLIFGMEGAEPILDDILLVDAFYHLGVRLIGLCWNWRNMVGDPCSSNAGLTAFGREVVKYMNDLGMLIDISHLSDESRKDVLKISRDPVVDSHSNCRALVSHPRNLSDELIKWIADEDGLIGLNFFSEFVAQERATLSKLLDHVDYLNDLIGIDHLCLGPDWIDYAPELFSEEEKRLELYDQEKLGKYVQDLDSVSKLPNLTAGLISRGYSKGEIRGILGENMLNLIKNVIG